MPPDRRFRSTRMLPACSWVADEEPQSWDADERLEALEDDPTTWPVEFELVLYDLELEEPSWP